MLILVFTLYKDDGWGLIIYFTREGRMLMVFSYIVWMSLHLQFTSYYLQSACLFRLTFRAQDDEDWDKVRRRKFWLQILEHALYSIFLAIFCYLYVTNGSKHDKSSETWDCVWFIFSSLVYLTIPVIGVSSARHITNNSKSVEQLGIRTNSRVMRVYLAFWVTLGFVSIAGGSCMIMLDYDRRLHHGQHVKYKVTMVVCILIAIRSLFVTCLDLQLFIAYYRISQKLSDKMSRMVTKNLRSDSSSSVNVQEYDGELLHAQRRLNRYRDQADE